jgi:uridine phosphorylase
VGLFSGGVVHDNNINHEFLDPIVARQQVDNYHHIGISSDDPIVEQLRDVRAVIMAGSGARIDHFAHQWSAMQGDSPVVKFPEEDRFISRYTAGVLFVSHGMGMPSASIAVQELMRLVYFLKDGDLDALDQIFWARVGTSGGVGLPGGTIVVTTEALLADLKPHRLLDGLGGYHWFDGTFPRGVADAIIEANLDSGIPTTLGKTVATNEFFIEQFRRDGAIALASADRKMEWLAWLADNGVRNIEMEGALVAGYLNYWGFSRFAMVCTTLLNRLEGDQITTPHAELQEFSERSKVVIFNYLKTIL